MSTRARQEIEAALDRSRREELDELHRAWRRSRSRRASLLGAWLGGWLTRQKRSIAEPLPDVTTGEVGLTWAGHATMVVRYARLVIACDPMLGNRLGAAKRRQLRCRGWRKSALDLAFARNSIETNGHCDAGKQQQQRRTRT